MSRDSLLQDLLRIVDDDESVADGGAALRGVRHDLHRTLHAADESDLHRSSTVRAAGGPHRGLDPLLRSRLELLVGAVGRYVRRVRVVANVFFFFFCFNSINRRAPPVTLSVTTEVTT